MRRFPLVAFCAVLIAAAACSSTSSDSGNGGEIRSEDDLQRLFEAFMPELVAALSELADQQFGVKQGSDGSSRLDCPDSGGIDVNLSTGETKLDGCEARGIILSGDIFLYIFSNAQDMYEASFSGFVTVGGRFQGAFEVVSAIITWTHPPTEANTYWDVTVRVEDQYFFASSISSGGHGGSGGNGGSELCADGDFELTPILDPSNPDAAGPQKPCTITREVCFHSETDIGCPVFNYRIGPSMDFSEYIDIFYGGGAVGCVDQMYAEFRQGALYYSLFGPPAIPPPTALDTTEPIVVNGDYNVWDDVGGYGNGTFDFYWPSRGALGQCP